MGHKILLADDSITIQKVVNLTFSDEGIDVVTVGNGELAIRKLNDVKPDVVLADIYMPGKNGYEVCEYIKTSSQFDHIPVLLLVGAFEPFDQAEALRVKADGHLTKPFESRALVATVTRLLAQTKLNVPPVSSSSPSNSLSQNSLPVANWQPPPPDATTTKLSPEVAARFAPNLSGDMYNSPISPVFQLPVTPPPTKTSSSLPPEPFGEKTLAYSSEELRSQIMPSGGNGFNFDLDLSSPPATLAQPTTTQPVMSLPTASPVSPFVADIVNFVAPVTEETYPVQETFPPLDKSLIIDNSAIRIANDNVAHNTISYNSTAIDSLSPLELDEVELGALQQPEALEGVLLEEVTEHQQEMGDEQKTAVVTYHTAESNYEDITPLDLEPLEDIGYQNSSSGEAVLEISSEVESPSISYTEKILEPELTTNFPDFDLNLASVSVDKRRETIEMASLSEDQLRNLTPPFPPMEVDINAEGECSTAGYPDSLVKELRSLTQEEIVPGTTFEVEEKVATPYEEDFSLDLPDENIPAAVASTSAVEATIAEIPVEISSVLPAETALATPLETESSLATAIETTNEASVDAIPAEGYDLSPSVPAVTTLSDTTPEVSVIDTAPEAIPVTKVDAATSLPFTSIEQIPQHLVDEIVRRAIVSITESVVREVVWEVVPDLAEILIKKHLEEKTLH